MYPTSFFLSVSNRFYRFNSSSNDCRPYRSRATLREQLPETSSAARQARDYRATVEHQTQVAKRLRHVCDSRRTRVTARKRRGVAPAWLGRSVSLIVTIVVHKCWIYNYLRSSRTYCISSRFHVHFRQPVEMPKERTPLPNWSAMGPHIQAIARVLGGSACGRGGKGACPVDRAQG